MRLAGVESQHLTTLIDQFLELLRDTELGTDVALGRLTPAVYPDDAEASAEFAAATSTDLLDRRAADARVVRAALAPLTVDDEAELAVAASELDPWLRTLTALRLVIASRLGIENGSAHDPDDPRFGVYDWLGYRLEVLVEAADALDDQP